jgi:Bacterial TniB protein
MTSVDANLHIDDVRLLPHLQRLPYVERVRVYYPLWHEIWAQVADCYEAQPYAAEPPCMMVVGPTGAGKSTLMNIFAQRYPPIWREDGKYMPVVKSAILPPATVKSMASSLSASRCAPKICTPNSRDPRGGLPPRNFRRVRVGTQIQNEAGPPGPASSSSRRSIATSTYRGHDYTVKCSTKSYRLVVGAGLRSIRCEHCTVSQSVS